MVVVYVQHLIDDTVTNAKFTGARVSTQLWDSGRACVKVWDEQGRRTQVWHAINVQTIKKVYE